MDAPDEVRHLVAAPLAPERVVRRRKSGAVVLRVEALNVRVVIADVAGAVFRIADAVEMHAVDVVRAGEMREDLDRVRRRFRIAEVDVPLGAEAVVAGARARSPLAIVVVRRVRRRIPEVPQKDVLRIARHRLRRVALPYRADDREGVHLDGARMRLFDEVPQRIEVVAQHLGSRLRGIEVPRVAAAAHLHEDGVRFRRRRGGNDPVDVIARHERRVKCFDPECAVPSGRERRRGKDDERKRE